MKKTTYQKSWLSCIICIGFLSAACGKYLNEPSDKSLAIITTLDDLQALLDHTANMNFSSPISQEVSADNYYLTDDGWESLSAAEDQYMYIWAENNVFRPGGPSNDWQRAYLVVYRANTVIENLQLIEKTRNNEERWMYLKGQALLYRAMSFLDAVQIWSVAYDSQTAQTDVGIPLRLQADFNLPSARASIQHTYDQIIADLKQAISLLPNTPIAKTRLSKPVAYGLLARAHLWMRDYPIAKLYADSCLMLANELMDYNQLNPTSNFPIPRGNVEIIFDRVGPAGQILATNRALIPMPLYLSYSDDDLRKAIFFRVDDNGLVSFRGNYYASASVHTGLATDEMYITRAECFARENRVEEAMNDLNTLLETRWKEGQFVPRAVASAEDALAVILEERRKQLLFRGLRWMDIKRLNKEGANISLTRNLKGDTYTLPANSPRFALPLPDDLLEFYP